MEKPTWRTRAYIVSVAPLSTKEFMVGAYRVVSRPELVGHHQKGVHIVDVILDGLSEPRAEEAHIIGMDTLEIFLDRISTVSYGRCQLLKVISTCPTEVRVGAPFNIVTEDLMMDVVSPVIEPENIAAFQ